MMTWHGVRCETHFHADGFFSCKWYGTWWNGRWSQKAGVLAVEEWPLDAPGRRTSWAVKLKTPSTGEMSDGSPWAVVPLGGAVR